MKTFPRRWWWSFAIATCALLFQLPAQADPPSRVVRLSDAAGQVSFNPAGSRDWVRVHLNRPIVAGDRLWVDASSRAELRLGQAALRLGEDTSVALLNFDDRMAQLRLTQGTAIISAKRLDRGQVLEVDTPNFAWRLNQPGLFRIEADPAGEWTEITVRSGKGEVYGEGRAFMLASGRTYRFYGTDLADYETYPLDPPDALERWAMNRDTQRERAIAARYVSPDVVGYEDLDRYGRWRTVANLGAVWLPDRVPAGWAPYREGHWAWIEPWGWTWIDEAPWGFAPSHYGRWARLDDQWAWVPGPRRSRAVYAPAVVQFVGGNGPRDALQVGGTSAVAWFPLAPNEVYRPPYEASRSYLVAVNASNTVVRPARNGDIFSAPQASYVYRQMPAAVVAVPTTTFAQARPVAPSALRMTPETATRQPVTTAAAVAPIIASLVGAAIEAHRKPPEASVDRAVIAKAAPPPAPAPFAARQEALASQAGKPLPAQPISPPAATATPAPPVKVVTAAAPATAPLAAKPASGANATARAERASETARSAAASASAPTLLPQALSRGAASAPAERAAQAPSPGAASAPAERTAQALSRGAASAPAERAAQAPSPGAASTSAERTAQAPSPGAASAPAERTARALSRGAASAPAERTTQAPSPGAASTSAERTARALSRGAASAPAERTTQAPSPGTASTPAERTAQAPTAAASVNQPRAPAPSGRTPPTAAAERSNAPSHATPIERPAATPPVTATPPVATAPRPTAPAAPPSVPARSAAAPVPPPPTAITRPAGPPAAPPQARASEAPARVAEGPRAPPVPLREAPASRPAARPASAPPPDPRPLAQASPAANPHVAPTPARPAASAAHPAASAASRPSSRASEERAPPHDGARRETKEGGRG